MEDKTDSAKKAGRCTTGRERSAGGVGTDGDGADEKGCHGPAWADVREAAHAQGEREESKGPMV